MNIAIVIQARKKSLRLKEKIFKKVNNKMLIEYLIERMLLTRIPVILAVPSSTFKDVIPIAKKYSIHVSVTAGNEENVLQRYYSVARNFKLNTIVRVTGDNPFTSIWCIKNLITKHKEMGNDLTHVIDILYGVGSEIIEVATLKKVHKSTKDKNDIEHVTPYIYRNPKKFKIYSWSAGSAYNYPKIHLSVDTQEDFKRFKGIIKNINKKFISVKDIIKYANSNVRFKKCDV